MEAYLNVELHGTFPIYLNNLPPSDCEPHKVQFSPQEIVTSLPAEGDIKSPDRFSAETVLQDSSLAEGAAGLLAMTSTADRVKDTQVRPFSTLVSGGCAIVSACMYRTIRTDLANATHCCMILGDQMMFAVKLRCIASQHVPFSF